MILIIAEDCPIFKPGAEPHLQSLLHTVVIKERHTIASPAPDRLKELLPQHVWNDYGESLVRGSKRAINSFQRWVQNADCSSCDPAKVAHFWELPTVLIVEDLDTDGDWFKLVSRKLRPRLMSYMDGRYIGLEIRHAGGIPRIPRELERMSQRYRHSRPSEGLPLRVIALADSDAKTPGNPSAEARSVAQTAQTCDAVAHILQKRTIENYLPDDSLHQYARRHPDRREAIHFITSLTGPARNYYQMKDGLSEAELAATGSMYPPGTPPRLGMGNFIRDFLTDYSIRVDEQSLRTRDGVSELEELLDLIEENL
jgi:hypothetical protein